jgi:hypothetical protein
MMIMKRNNYFALLLFRGDNDIESTRFFEIITNIQLIFLFACFLFVLFALVVQPNQRLKHHKAGHQNGHQQQQHHQQRPHSTDDAEDLAVLDQLERGPSNGGCVLLDTRCWCLSFVFCWLLFVS